MAEPAARVALIGLGANLGPREATLRAAVARLAATRGINNVETSSVYETEPVGVTDQPRFLNQAAVVQTTLSPESLLRVLQAIEAEFGRERLVRWGPRTLDLDLLAYEGEERKTAELQLPHPRLWERGFVVVPLRELLHAPGFQGPAWADFRSRLGHRLADEAGVRAYPPAEAPHSALAAAPLETATAAFLIGLKRKGVSLGLERMQTLVDDLGNPERRVPVIHVAGTNGKGSVAAMLESILRTAGWKTGLYTSPHLIRLGERIQVNRQPLANPLLAEHVREIRPVLERRAAEYGPDAVPSYFEVMTAIALRHFERVRCDIAIVEVGMGGRLDATNVVNPELSVITSIGLDHCEFLGTTLAAIAAEKAGIIKSGRPVVMGRLPADAERVVRAVATRQGAPLVSVAEAWGDDFRTYPETNLAGEYQRLNAATATVAARQLGARWRLSEDVIARGLRHVEWAGRWQRLEIGGRRVIVDASHNAEGAVMLERSLGELEHEAGTPPVVVVGVLGPARAKSLLPVICEHAREVHLVIPRQKRACTYAQLEALIPATYRGRIHRSTIETVFPSAGAALPEVSAAVPLVVTGSIYLAGEVLAHLDPARGPLESELQDF